MRDKKGEAKDFQFNQQNLMLHLIKDFFKFWMDQENAGDLLQ